MSNGARGDFQCFYFSVHEMASLVPPNYVCPRADDVVLYLDSFFICWLVLESLPVKRDSFPCLISLTFAVLLFFSSREKKKKGIPGVLCSERGSEWCAAPRNERWKFLIY